MIQFTKAVKAKARLRMAISGPSGSGKTFTALAVGTALAENGRVAVVDTEHGSASKYADLFEFDVLELAAPFHPQRFVEAIQAASAAGYDVVILDSMSHAWNGPGGLLEIVDQIATRMKTSNTFAAWKDATPIQNALVEALLSAPVHVIATMRSKQEYVLEQVERNGRTTTIPKKIGMAPVQRDAFEYEFDVFSEMDMENNLMVTKTRCSALSGAVIPKPGSELAGTLRAWLTDGADVPAPAVRVISDAQRRRLFAVSHDAGWGEAALRHLILLAGFDSSKKITPDAYDELVKKAGDRDLGQRIAAELAQTNGHAPPADDEAPTPERVPGADDEPVQAEPTQGDLLAAAERARKRAKAAQETGN